MKSPGTNGGTLPAVILPPAILDRRNTRSLDSIAHDLHKLEQGERANIFEKGRLLVEAKETLLEDGQWLEWCETEFDWSHDTARNYISAFRLSEKVRTVRTLKVPARIIYGLANDYLDDPDLPVIVEALHKAAKSAKKKNISTADAEVVIDLAVMRVVHGDLPDATLYAVDSLHEDDGWRTQAIATLKKEQPETEEAADAIIKRLHREHVASQYATHGTLPENVPDDALYLLENEPEDRRQRILEGLLRAEEDGKGPLTREVVQDIINKVWKESKSDLSKPSDDSDLSKPSDDPDLSKPSDDPDLSTSNSDPAAEQLRRDFLQAAAEAQRLARAIDLTELPIDGEVLDAADDVVEAWRYVSETLDKRVLDSVPTQDELIAAE